MSTSPPNILLTPRATMRSLRSCWITPASKNSFFPWHRVFRRVAQGGFQGFFGYGALFEGEEQMHEAEEDAGFFEAFAAGVAVGGPVEE